MISYLVTSRSREIGLRFALGAQHKGILALLLGFSMGLTLAGLALGLVISFWSMKALAHSLYQVDRADLSVHLAAVAALALTALAASLLPALRALAIEPAEALRDE